MSRVILEMDVHCTDCAKKIRKAVENYLGVEKVSASPHTGLVVIAGTADAETLRRRIQHKLRRPVDIVSDGVAPDAGWEPNHWAPPQFAPPYGGRVMPHPYGAPQPAYAYQYGAGNHWAPPPPPPPPPYRHMSYGASARHDDEEGPGTFCSIQ